MSAVGRQHCFGCTRSKRIRPDLLRMQTVRHQHGTPRSSAAPETAQRFEFLLTREKQTFSHVSNKRGGIINVIVTAHRCVGCLCQDTIGPLLHPGTGSQRIDGPLPRPSTPRRLLTSVRLMARPCTVRACKISGAHCETAAIAANLSFWSGEVDLGSERARDRSAPGEPIVQSARL